MMKWLLNTSTEKGLIILSMIVLQIPAHADTISGASEHNVIRSAINNGTSVQYTESTLQLINYNFGLQPRPSPALGNMMDDSAIAETAQLHAAKCKTEHSSSADRNSNGENLFWGSGTSWSVNAAVSKWAAEASDYTHASNTCAAGKVCGHYTQVAWDDSTKVGCAKQTCEPLLGSDNNPKFEGAASTLVVCQYNPAGNSTGTKPYEAASTSGSTDTTPPVVTPPKNITATSTGTTTPVTIGQATATDNVDGALASAKVTADKTGPFTVGTHTITWSATDAAGNKGSATQTVTITAAPGGTGGTEGSATDTDGVSDAEEQAAPNNGDGNNDSIADSTQTNVSSVKGSTPGTYITVDVTQSSACTISNVSATAAGTDSAGFSYEAGLVNFTLNCASANVALYFHGLTTAPEQVRKYGITPSSNTTKIWYDMPGATIVPVNIAGKTVYKASYTLTDGQPGDDDLTANGAIVDPVGLAIAKATTGGTGTASTVQNIPFFTPFGLLASLLGLLWFGRRRTSKTLR